MRPALEVADIVRAHGDEFRQAHAASLSPRQKRVLRNIELCRTAALGGHLERCDQCGHERNAYNSCVIAIAPNASPPRVISGLPNEPRNCFPSPTAMWFSRFRKHSHRWRYRTHSWCMHCCFVRYLRPCWRSPPIHDASEHRSVSLRCYIAGAKTCSTTPIFTVWSPQEDSRPTGRGGSTAAASSSCRSRY